MHIPKVSVIIPTYQSAHFLPQSIGSVLKQTYKDFEVIVVDDGSTDQTSQVLSQFCDRIRVVTQPNCGPSVARNTGIADSSGAYIALLDADDLALRDRFEKQVAYLDDHLDVGMIGSASYIIDKNGRNLGIQSLMSTDLAIRWTSLLLNPFTNSSVMIRKNLLIENGIIYDSNLFFGEDYDLFSRIMIFSRVANLSKPLAKYRINKNTLSNLVNDEKLQSHFRISLRNIRTLLPDATISDNDVKMLCYIFMNGNSTYPGLRVERVHLVERFLDLWECFSKHFTSLSELEILSKKVAVKAARITLYPPLPPGWLKVTSRLTAIDPLWWLHYIVTLPYAIIENIRERKMNSLRK